jgi:PIN domain nuclease of toxin-antitoxin system
MLLLLDTHVLLWTIFEPKKLSDTMRTEIVDTHNVVYISMVSLWEIAIKQSIGRLSIPDVFFDAVYKKSGFEVISLGPKHVEQYRTLPLYHRDPFDRMLIAQAHTEKLTLVTSDEKILQYDVSILK